MAAIGVWFAVAGSYLILAGQFSPDEAAVAALLGLLGAAWHGAVLRAGARRFAFDRHALAEIGRALAGLPSATVKVGGRLASGFFRAAEGRSVTRVFTGGRQEQPQEAGRRAVVVLATSLSPDAYVLRVPLDEDTILFHGVTDRVPGGDPRWPA